ncbi:MAG: hypothetical protein A2Y70_03630 [Candidatus Aminicenantes bacterium RBG_13_64_14]|nr:MAG: hypothetical protein A2Y70_03630 [Candidatus Aminicenantes bacterium RBG_13_64_14]
MIEHDPDDIERSLGQLVPKSASPGLRERVLDSAFEARKYAALTPRMRLVAVVCSILIVAVLGADSLLGRHESAQIAALLDDPGVLAQVEEDVRLLWAEVGGDLGELDKFRREGIFLSRLGSRGGSGWAYLEARDWLKGMFDHEDPENYY